MLHCADVEAQRAEPTGAQLRQHILASKRGGGDFDQPLLITDKEIQEQRGGSELPSVKGRVGSGPVLWPLQQDADTSDSNMAPRTLMGILTWIQQIWYQVSKQWFCTLAVH